MSDAPTRPLAPASPEAQHQALLEVAEAISQHHDLEELFHELAARLHGVVEFDFLNLILHDASRNVMRLHILETEATQENSASEREFPVGETPCGMGLGNTTAVRAGRPGAGNAISGADGDCCARTA